MSDHMAGFPYWQLEFDEQAQMTSPRQEQDLEAGVAAEGVTDLLMFAHGWNNSQDAARRMYDAFFQQLRDVLGGVSGRLVAGKAIGTAGVIWPSMLWPDEPAPPNQGGAASFSPRQPLSDAQLVQSLKAVFTAPAQQQTLDKLAALLDHKAPSAQALSEFYGEMVSLASNQGALSLEDSGERSLFASDYQTVFGLFSAAMPLTSQGGAAGLGDVFGKLWNGAKNALRVTTYFEMKKRAGVIGVSGLGPLIGRLQQAKPGLRVHLLGHSFGARLSSYALSGLPAGGSPINSITLLQGAFSHFAFAASLPQDPARGGGLAGMAARVDGPLVVSHSVYDLAVGKLYPLASMLARDDASAFDLEQRWGAMGFDGAQAVSAADLPLLAVGQSYPFEPGKFCNLNGDQVIRQGDPPSGAHGDIFHPEIAWAVLLAAGLAA